MKARSASSPRPDLLQALAQVAVAGDVAPQQFQAAEDLADLAVGVLLPRVVALGSGHCKFPRRSAGGLAARFNWVAALPNWPFCEVDLAEGLAHDRLVVAGLGRLGVELDDVAVEVLGLLEDMPQRSIALARLPMSRPQLTIAPQAASTASAVLPRPK